MPQPTIVPVVPGFIQINTQTGPALINLAHVNSVTPTEHGTHLGINNYGARGYDAAEPFEEIVRNIAAAMTPQGCPHTPFPAASSQKGEPV